MTITTKAIAISYQSYRPFCQLRLLQTIFSMIFESLPVSCLLLKEFLNWISGLNFKVRFIFHSSYRFLRAYAIACTSFCKAVTPNRPRIINFLREHWVLSSKRWVQYPQKILTGIFLLSRACSPAKPIGSFSRKAVWSKARKSLKKADL